MKPQQGRAVPQRRSREREVVFWRRRLVAFAVIAAALVALADLVGGEGKGGLDPASSEASAPAPPTAAERRARDDAAIDAALRRTPVVRSGGGRGRAVALTFDDGPGTHTDQIRRILERHGARGTFFLSGYMLDEHGDEVRRLVRGGHAIGNHGQNHRRMGDLSPRDQRYEIAAVERALAERGIRAPRMFRAPYGSFDETTLELLARRRALLVLWSVETGDYVAPGPEAIAQRALDGAEPGAIILMHDAGGDRSATLAALPQILRGLRERGLRAVTVPELLRRDPPRRQQGLDLGAAAGG